jgi:hypothetical protein
MTEVRTIQADGQPLRTHETSGQRQLRNILVHFGLESLRGEIFKTTPIAEGGNPTSDIKGQLNTYVLSSFGFAGGAYTDNDGNQIEYDGLMIHTAIVKISQSRNIVRTNIPGRNGTFKEYVSEGDWEISLKGIIVNEEERAYPEDDVRRLKELLEVPEQITVVNELLEIFEIDKVVVASKSIPQVEGFHDVQGFEVRFFSDIDLELEISE